MACSFHDKQINAKKYEWKFGSVQVLLVGDCININSSKLSSIKRLLSGLNTLPVMLKNLSTVDEEAGTVRNLLAIIEISGNFDERLFQYINGSLCISVHVHQGTIDLIFPTVLFSSFNNDRIIHKDIYS